MGHNFLDSRFVLDRSDTEDNCLVTLACAARTAFAAVGRVSGAERRVVAAALAQGDASDGMSAEMAADVLTSAVKGFYATFGSGARRGPQEVEVRLGAEQSPGIVWLTTGNCLMAVWNAASEEALFAAIVHDGPKASFPRWQRQLVKMALMAEKERQEAGPRVSGTPDKVVLERVLDRITLGLAIVDQSGRVVYANAAGRTWLAKPRDLRIVEGRLVAESRKVQQRLSGALKAATRERSRKSSVVSLFEDIGNPLLKAITVIPLDDDLPHALVALGRQPQDPLLRDLVLQQFGLTPAERRLTLSLVSGECLEAAARQSNVKPSTARSYLRQVFEKTGTRRQSELVAMLSSIAPPIAQTTAADTPRPDAPPPT